MAIRPVDMQIMMPRMADLSMIHQAEKERPVLEQLQMANQQNKQVERNAKVVQKSPKDTPMKNDADAKDKGKNTYTYHPKKRNSTEMEKEEDHPMGGRLDVKV